MGKKGLPSSSTLLSVNYRARNVLVAHRFSPCRWLTVRQSRSTLLRVLYPPNFLHDLTKVLLRQLPLLVPYPGLSLHFCSTPKVCLPGYEIKRAVLERLRQCLGKLGSDATVGTVSKNLRFDPREEPANLPFAN